MRIFFVVLLSVFMFAGCGGGGSQDSETGNNGGNPGDYIDNNESEENGNNSDDNSSENADWSLTEYFPMFPDENYEIEDTTAKRSYSVATEVIMNYDVAMSQINGFEYNSRGKHYTYRNVSPYMRVRAYVDWNYPVLDLEILSAADNIKNSSFELFPLVPEGLYSQTEAEPSVVSFIKRYNTNNISLSVMEEYAMTLETEGFTCDGNEIETFCDKIEDGKRYRWFGSLSEYSHNSIAYVIETF